MNAHTTSLTGFARGRWFFLALVLATSFSTALPTWSLAAEESPAPTAGAPLEPSLAPTQAACESVDDLQLVVDFLRQTDVSEDGWSSVLVGAIAGLSLAHELVALVGETYGPLVDDLVASFEGLRTTVEGLRDQATVGAGLAAIGEAIADVGVAMDAISTQLRTPCPDPA